MAFHFSKPFVVLPTYNERENIVNIVPALFSLPIDNLHILVVDDSSPDGTAPLVKEMVSKFPRLLLFSRPKKEGLGRAYVAGFLEALRQGADAIVQMDADFSHDFNDVPRLLKELEQGSYLAIGSRYISGGKTKNWSKKRLFLSKSANIYAKFITKMPIFDTTGGFKAWRADCLKNIDLPSIQTNGYGFQIETSFRAFKRGYTIAEIPIVFSERRAGASKMSRKIIWEALWLVWKLRYQVGAPPSATR
ncbi:MAG: polyprenol monophosphomannose synthase [Deltaproteobacteria bacterium]|nr:polyprenol monophosphomannose synthase [Deltaproteobacteria bacterium]